MPLLGQEGTERFDDETLRKHAAKLLSDRVASFSTKSVQNHPQTVAALVKSSLSTAKLVTVANHLDKAWEQARMRAMVPAVRHDFFQQPYAGPTEDAALQAEITRIKTELARPGLTMQQRIDLIGGPSRYPGLSADQVIENAARQNLGLTAGGGNPVAAISEGFMAPFSMGLAAGGESLDWLGKVPVIGQPIRFGHTVLDVGLNVAGKGAAIAGRTAIGLPIGAAESAIAEAKGEDVDWRGLLGFWQLEQHDPVTVGVANLMGMDVNDPKFAETAQTVDILAGVGEQVILAKLMVKGGEYVKTPGEMGGLLDSRTWVDHDFLNGRYFEKAARLFEDTPPGQRVGKFLQSVRRTDPRLARTMADAYEFGETKAARVASMKNAFVDYIKNDTAKLDEHLLRVNEGLNADPGNTALRVEKIRVEHMLEDVAAKDPVDLWPRYQDVRGALKGSEPTTRAGRYIKALYDHRPAKAVSDVTKFTDNLRNRFRVHDWEDPKAPADALRQNAQNVTRGMRSARVPNDIIAMRIGEMLDGSVPFSEWYMRVTEDIANAAKSWADPVAVKKIVSTMRNDEMFTNRANYDTIAVDERTGATATVRRPVLESPSGTHAPTQMNEVSHGAKFPAFEDIRAITSEVARLKQTPITGWIKKQFDNVMSGWRATTITARGPAINMAIQSEEALTSFFTNTPQKFLRRTVNWVVHKLPLSEEAQAAVAQRLGFADVYEAREVYRQLKKNPESIGQMVANYSEETTKRLEVPSTRFNSDFMDGAVDLNSRLAKQNFADLVWQIEHTATSHDMRTLLNQGVERTADLMRRQEVVPKDLIGNGQVTLRFDENPADYYFTAKPVEWKASIMEKGLDIDRVQGYAKGIHFSEDPRAYPITEANPKNLYRVKRSYFDQELPEARLGEGTDRTIYRRSGEDLFSEKAIRPEDIEVFTEEGWKPLETATLEPPTRLQRWYETTLRQRIAEDTSYAGLSPRDALVEFLTRKETELETLAGGHPEVRTLMADGETNQFRLADPDGELLMRQEEIQQGHFNLEDPEVGTAQRLALIERRDALLKAAETEGAPAKRLKVSRNNTAIRSWLMKEAQEGRYTLPAKRWTLVTKSGYETGAEMSRGVISKITKVEYALMKYMNSDLIRSGFAEAKYTKWKDRYLKAGWTEPDAAKAAMAQAAFEVRDWLHDIGNKSSAQRFLRNEFPFLHAWERVAYRWTVKIPNMMGAGFTPLGWGIGSNIVNGVEDLMKQVGIIKVTKNPDGTESEHVYLPNPLSLLNWIPKFEAPAQIDVLDPETVIFPPRHLISGLPGLAPQAAFLLDKAADMTHSETFRALHDEFTHEGAFVLQFPGSGLATKIWEAVTGEVPPWAIGHSKKYQEYVVGRAHDAALRYAYTDMAKEGILPPNPADFETREAYAVARDKFWAQLSSTANEYFSGISFTYLLAAESPLSSFRPTTQEETAWKSFLAENGLNKERDEHDYQLINDYLAEHPESLAFNVSMYDRASKWPEDKGYTAFRDAIGAGDIKLKTYAQFRGALALAQEWDYKNQADAQALQAVGLGNWDKMSAANQLRNYGKYVEATSASWGNFDEFLDENDAAKRMYEKYQTVAQRVDSRVQEIKRDWYNLERAGKDPQAMIQAEYAKRAAQTEYGDTKADHVKWYKYVVMNDYYSKTHAIFDRIDELEASKVPNADDLIAREWDKLRDINNNWPEVVGEDGQVYPSPEEFYFAQKPLDVQQDQKGTWASLPPSWLSNFAYTTTYGKPSGNVKKYFDAEGQVWDYFNKKTEGLSTASNEYASWKDWRENSLDILAKRADVMAVRRLEKAPDIVRLRAAGLTPDTEGMNWIVEAAQGVANKLAANDVSLFGASEDAQYYRGWLESWISRMRDPGSPIYDAKVDRFFTQQAKKTGITFEPALYRLVLFGIEGSFEIKYDFSAENKMARAS